MAIKKFDSQQKKLYIITFANTHLLNLSVFYALLVTYGVGGAIEKLEFKS